MAGSRWRWAWADPSPPRWGHLLWGVCALAWRRQRSPVFINGAGSFKADSNAELTEVYQNRTELSGGKSHRKSLRHKNGGIMRSKTLASLGILLGLAISPAFAQVESVAGSRPTGIMAPLAPIHPDGGNAPGGPLTVVDSPDWAGYAVTGSAFTSVKGSWVVPKYHCLKTPNSGSGFAVGIDGYDNNYFEEIGTASNCVGTQYQYYASYYLSSTDYATIPSVPVKSGDLISAEVSYTGSKFAVRITNETTGKTFSKSAAVSGAPRDSAEWIVGRIGGFPSIMDFGTLSSGDDYTTIIDSDWATDSSVSGPISDFGSKVVEINMIYGGIIYATTTPLTTDGSSFQVNWKHE